MRPDQPNRTVNDVLIVIVIFIFVAVGTLVGNETYVMLAGDMKVGL